MTMTQPFRVVVEDLYGMRYYVLRSKVVWQVGNVKRAYFFAPEGDAADLPVGFVVNETIPQAAPVEGSAKVALALVREIHLDPDVAAQLAGWLKATGEKLTEAQTARLVQQIRNHMKQESM